jgi:VanZ family protein
VLLFSFMTALWLFFLLTYSPGRHVLVIAIVASLLVGTLAEFAQVFVATRGPSLLDLTANCVGVIIPTIGVIIWTRHKPRHRPLPAD